jgi:hypothetical protein
VVFVGRLAGRKHKDALPSNNILLSYSTNNNHTQSQSQSGFQLRYAPRLEEVVAATSIPFRCTKVVGNLGYSTIYINYVIYMTFFFRSVTMQL